MTRDTVRIIDNMIGLGLCMLFGALLASAIYCQVFCL